MEDIEKTNESSYGVYRGTKEKLRVLENEKDPDKKFKGVTYILSDSFNDEPMWEVPVFVKNVREEGELRKVCYGGNSIAFEGGEEIYDYGKCEIEGYPKTLLSSQFLRMLDEQLNGKHTLEAYCKQYIGANKKRRRYNEDKIYIKKFREFLLEKECVPEDDNNIEL